jgi:serine O-acetyltransferase
MALLKIDVSALAMVAHRMIRGNAFQRIIAKALRKIAFLTCGIEIHPSAEIGERLYIAHIGHVVIGEGVKIGNNGKVLHLCSLGVAGSGKRRGYPQIGDNVYIGVNSVVVGKITIGNSVTIGPSSVVTINVPDHAICLGNPARVMGLKEAGREPLCAE